MHTEMLIDGAAENAGVENIGITSNEVRIVWNVMVVTRLTITHHGSMIYLP